MASKTGGGDKVADMLTTTQAAKIIGCTDSRVRQLVRAGLIPHVKVGPRAVLISQQEAEKMRDKPHTTGRPRTNAG